MVKALLATLAITFLVASAYAVSGRGDSGQEVLNPAVEMSLARLQPPPVDPSNRWADDTEAAELGHKLFFDQRLSRDGSVSCATCHEPRRDFQDGLALARGVGVTDRRSMPIAATAYSPFLFWDGRKDSQWAQALGPLESPVEHGGHRAMYVEVVAAHYRADYERIFGPLPRSLREPAGSPDGSRPTWEQRSQSERDALTQVFVNMGKAIAAYERRIQFGTSRFDAFVEQWAREGKQPRGVLTAEEVAGMRLFLGKANCVQCHNGPLLTNNEFHNTGVPARMGLPGDRGRIAAVSAVQADEFNCRSRWSDAKPEQCVELEFLAPANPSLERAFKVPSLRNVAERAPYMHAGQFPTLADVLAHYNTAPEAPAGHSELKPLGLTPAQIRQLEAFLRTLSGGISAPARFLEPPSH